MDVANVGQEDSVIDLENDTLVPVADVSLEMTGKRKSPPTISKMVRPDDKGIRLEAYMVNGRWCTTTLAFARYIKAKTAAALGVFSSEDRSGATQTGRDAVTERRLQAAGLI